MVQRYYTFFFFMKIDTYRNLYLILKCILQYIYDTDMICDIMI